MTRVRTRNIDVDDRPDADDKPVVPTQMVVLAEAVHDLNKEANAKTRAMNAKRKELATLMAKSNHRRFTIIRDDKQLEVTYEQGEKESIDVAGLIKKVGLNKVVDILGTSKTAVKDLFGDNLMRKFLLTSTGDYSVKIKKL